MQPEHLPITSIANASTRPKRKHVDQYKQAQSRQRKAANVARQVELKAQRKIDNGDPVRGTLTPFVQQFDKPTSLNHSIKEEELERSIQHSYILSQPALPENIHTSDPAEQDLERNAHEYHHERAAEALKRVLAIENGSQKDKTRANIQLCIDTFGRHNTDKVLRPRAPAANTPVVERAPRAGPDTGSSEVQIGILTAKIRVLADNIDLYGHKDKINKRNLRVLVHKRQKHLNYMRRKERGSERWQNMISLLGIGEASYKGEISM